MSKKKETKEKYPKTLYVDYMGKDDLVAFTSVDDLIHDGANDINEIDILVYKLVDVGKAVPGKSVFVSNKKSKKSKK